MKPQLLEAAEVHDLMSFLSAADADHLAAVAVDPHFHIPTTSVGAFHNPVTIAVRANSLNLIQTFTASGLNGVAPIDVAATHGVAAVRIDAYPARAQFKALREGRCGSGSEVTLAK